MTDFEIDIDYAISEWYHNHQHEADYFDNHRWVELFNEQKQIAAQLFWEKMVS